MIRAAERIHDPVEFYEGHIPVGDAIMLGGRRCAMFSGLGELLTEWLHRERFHALGDAQRPLVMARMRQNR